MKNHAASRSLRTTAAALLPVLSLLPAPASAALIYWDLNGPAPGAGAIPSGTWDASTPNWNTDPGGEGAGPQAWIPTETAVFSAGTDALSEYFVSIIGTQQTGGVIVKDGIVNFTGGAAGINTGTLSVVNNATLSIDSTLRISGSPGARLVLDGGTLRQTNPGNAGSFISASIDLEIGAGGGTVNYTSSGTGTISIYGGATGTITGTGVLTKTGPHEFRYQGNGLPNSTYSKLVVKEGLFRLGFNQSVQDERGFGAVPAAFTPDAITLDGGTIGGSFNITLHANRGVTLGPAGGSVNTAAASFTIPGAITGSGSLTKMDSDDTPLTLTLGGNSDYTGPTFVNSGVLVITNGNALGSIVGETQVAASAELRVSGAANTFTVNESIHINGPGATGGGALAILNGATPTFAGPIFLSGDAAITVSSGASATFSDTLAINSLSNENLTLKGTSSIGGTVVGAITLNGGGLTKDEAGTWTIAGPANYSGLTSINAGRLIVNGALSGTSSVDVVGTLSGSGSIAPAPGGFVSIAQGGKLAPGPATGPGNLTATLTGGGRLDVSSAVFIANSQALEFQLGAVASSDKVTIRGGSLDIASGVLEFDDFVFTTLAGFDPSAIADYVLFDGDTPINGSLGLNRIGLVGGADAELMLGDGGNDLILHVIPEPASATLLLGGLGLLARRRRQPGSSRFKS